LSEDERAELARFAWVAELTGLLNLTVRQEGMRVIAARNARTPAHS
jgi:hypothetical protein